MNAIVRSNYTRNPEQMCGMSVGRAGHWIPTFGRWVWVRVERGNDNGPEDDWRSIEIDNGAGPGRRTANRDCACVQFYEYPATFFVSLGRNGRQGIVPGVF
jgi:hypothetical protein